MQEATLWAVSSELLLGFLSLELGFGTSMAMECAPEQEILNHESERILNDDLHHGFMAPSSVPAVQF